MRLPDVWRELDEARTETKRAQAVALLAEGAMKERVAVVEAELAQHCSTKEKLECEIKVSHVHFTDAHWVYTAIRIIPVATWN